MRFLALACACFVTLVPVGHAQTTKQTDTTSTSQGQLPLVPGMRVRVTAPNLVSPLIANYLENKADTLLFFEEKAGRGIWSLTLDQITKIEVTLGEQPHHRQYIVRYGLIGSAAGALAFGYFASNFHPGDKSKDYSTMGTAAIGALVGGGLGAYLGSRAKAEKWGPLTLPKKLAIGPDGTGRWHVNGLLVF
ncbi:MAG: hypothetical protein MNPFHGCM_00159 [Gemmatimonadaceae bacterium]|nr:hypothetical protein [Gemmatimonadaceae bacterium]